MAEGVNRAADKPYRIFLLGAPEVWHAGERLQVRRRQVRALLYYLAHAREPVTREKLAFLFWPDRPESAPRRNLSRLLSAAKGELGEGLLVRQPERVALAPSQTWVDCAAFERLSASARRQALGEAAALYRGRFLEGFAILASRTFAAWQDEQQRTYERVYLDLLRQLVDLCRAAGEPAVAIEHARRYLAVDELAEEIHRRLIALHAASGDRAAAARQFEQCTLVLERELGVSPLPETRAAYEAALAEADAPAAVARRWSVLPSLDLPLTGREETWQALADAHRRLQSGGLILISGEPGVGKSRLIQAFARASDSFVLAGNNPPGAQGSAYTALAEALRQALPERARWQGIRPIWLAEVGRLLPEMGEFFPELPPPVDVEPAQAQARLFEGLSRCLQELAAPGPLLLCLDDVHWADAATLAWLATLPGRLAGSGLCILATYRSAHAGALADLKRAFARAGRLAEVPLSRLPVAAVQEILEQVPQSPGAPQPLAERIHRATGGNTFFVLETVRALLEAGQLADPPAALPLAPTVEAAIRRRLGNLSPLGRQVVETAAVLATDLEFDLLQETAGRSALEVAEGLDELVGRQLLVGGDGRRFGHELLRQVAYEEISPWRRRLLHRRAAGALEAAGGRDGKAAWTAIAGHYDRAGDAAEAIRGYERAARSAQALYAHEEAIHYLQRAIELASEARDETAILSQLYGALGDNLTISGAFSAAEEAYRAVLPLAPEGDPMLQAELERKLAATLSPQERSEEAESLLRTAMSRLDSPPPAVVHAWQSERLNILLELQDALYFQWRPEAMAELNEEIQPLLETVGTAEQSADFYARLNRIAFLQNRFRPPARNITLARKALAEAQTAGHRGLVARQEFHLGFHLLWRDHYVESEPMLQQALAKAEELGDSWLHTQSLVYLTILYRLQGKRSQVAAYLPQLGENAQQLGNHLYIAASQAIAAWLHFRDGEWLPAQAKAEAAVANWEGTVYPLQWLAHWLLLAMALRQQRLPDAIAPAQAMLDPGQQQLPAEIEAALATAVAAWEAGDESAVKTGLKTAVELAGQHGYL